MMRLPAGDASERLTNIGWTFRRIYSDPNSGDEGCSRTSAAGSWMVGPPSSWSLRDQEDAIWPASSSDCPRVDASPSLSGCEDHLPWELRMKMSGPPPLGFSSGGPRRLIPIFLQDSPTTSSASPSCSFPERVAASEAT